MTSGPPRCLPPDPHPRRPQISIPSGAWDCHAHIVGPVGRYPLQPDRSYTPAPASRDAYQQVLDTLGLERAVIVQPSFYGTDNRCTLDALRAAHGRWRGVVVIDPDIEETALREMHTLGVRGVRINLRYRGGVGLDAIERTAERIRPHGWHMQFLLDGRALPDLEPRLSTLGVDIVIDHMGHIPVAAGVDHPGFRCLLRMLKSRRCWIKLSGAYRISDGAPEYEDAIPFARALVDTAPDRLVWATDWPHPAISGPMPNDGELLDLLARWAPDPDVRRRILVENPRSLYDGA